MENTNKHDWLEEAKKDIAEFEASKFGKITERKLDFKRSRVNGGTASQKPQQNKKIGIYSDELRSKHKSEFDKPDGGYNKAFLEAGRAHSSANGKRAKKEGYGIFGLSPEERQYWCEVNFAKATKARQDISLTRQLTILSLINKEEFTSKDMYAAVELYNNMGLDKKQLSNLYAHKIQKNKDLCIQTHKGKNQFNPSTWKAI